MAIRETVHAIPGTPENPGRSTRAPLRPYSPPIIESLGDVRELTMGGSPGLNDSTNPGSLKPLV